MRLTACTCRAEHYQRRERAWWMKAIWRRGLYRCYACDAMMLIPNRSVDRRLRNQRGDAFAPTDLLYREPAGRTSQGRQKPA